MAGPMDRSPVAHSPREFAVFSVKNRIFYPSISAGRGGGWPTVRRAGRPAGGTAAPAALDQKVERRSQTCHSLIGNPGGLFGLPDQRIDFIIGGLPGIFGGLLHGGDMDIL